MQLAPFQQKAVHDGIESLDKHGSSLLVLATGLGKTVIFSHIAKHYVERGRVKILAHRTELIEQAASKVRHCIGINPGIEKAEHYSPESSMWGAPRVVVGSVQTQIAGHGEGRRMHRFNPDDFSLLIIDEAHHAVADSYRGVVDHYRQNPNLKLLGVTATPDRKDKLAMGMMFADCPFRMDIRDGLDQGYLVPIVAQMIEVHGLDLSACKTTGGDLNGADLRRCISADERILLGFAAAIVENASQRKTLVFCDSIDNAMTLTQMLNAHRDYSANLITGKTPDDQRSELIRQFREGGYQYQVNVGIATEGYDVPDISCIALCRPTKSRALYTQMVGRGTRPVANGLYQATEADDRKAMILASNKPDLLLLDFVGNSGKHKLIHLGSILGGKFTAAEIALAEKRMQESKKPTNIDEELQKARTELARQPHKMKAKAHSKVTVVDLFDSYDVRVQPQSGMAPRGDASDKQLKALENMGFDVPEGITKAEASVILNKAFKRRDMNLVFRPKVIKQLKRHGYDYENMSIQEANGIMGRLAANNWKPIRTCM